MTFLLPDFSYSNHDITMARAKGFSVRTIMRKSKRTYSDLTLSLRIPTAITKYITKFIRLTHAVPFLQNREKDDRFAIALTVLGGSPRGSELLPSIQQSHFYP